MPKPTLVTRLEQQLGFELKHIDGVEAYMQKKYPPSYLQLMTPAEEMVGSVHSRTAFTEGEKLVGLNLFGCEVKDKELAFFRDPSFQDKLKHLMAINLVKTQITQFTLAKSMPELVFVTLNENEQLERVKCEAGLGKLARLEISETSIKRFQIPKGYDRLYYLDLSDNKKLERFQFAEGGCAFLQVLLIRGTALTSFTLPEGFPELVHLFLNDNQLEEVHIRSQLPKLSCLQLRNNSLKQVDENILKLAPKLDSWFMGDNELPEELSFQMAEMKDQDHLPIIKEYFEQRKSGIEKNNEVKVLLIGNGKAGKSAIVNRIVNDNFDEEWDTTHGVSLLPKDLGPYRLNFWDFGGQDIYHATHRLFMQKNAVYILAWSQGTEKSVTPSGIYITRPDGSVTEKMYPNKDLRYWLEYAHHLGEDSPMHVVQTKVGMPGNTIEEKPDLEAEYQDTFQPKISFHHVESSDDDPFDNGYDQLLKSLEHSVGHIKQGDSDDIAKSLYDIRKYLRDQQEAGVKTLPLKTYLEKAEELGVLSPQKMLETWLFKSGVVYYQPGRFNDEIILDQGWAIKAIYTLFDRKKGIPYQLEASKGIFNGAFVQDIWREEGFPDQDTHELFISFMKSCDLCFEVEKQEKRVDFRERVFMIPQLLENERPSAIDDFWEGRQALYYSFTDRFIHEGVIHSFVSKTAYLAKLREIWKLGIQIKDGTQYAQIEAGKNEIRIRLTPNAEPLLFRIRELLRDLQGGKGQESISRDGKTFEPLETFMPSEEGEQPSLRSLLSRKQQLDKSSSVPPTADPSPAFTKGESLKIESPQDEAFLEEKISELLGKHIRAGHVDDASFEKHGILFLAANPHDTDLVQTRKELDLAIGKLGRGGKDNLYHFEKPIFAATILELILALKCKPRVLHFSGHGLEEGIILHSETEQAEPLPISAVPRVFKNLKGVTEIVILNACYSQAQAKAISELGFYVIGTNYAVKDDAAISFTSGFYSALGQGESFEDCYNDALAVVMTRHPSQAHIFEAWHNGQQLNW
jgi:hypothetical protein